mgnify:CR=1 FL=1
MERMNLQKVIVPNRGEIAVRIARACREAGTISVLPHAEDDDVRFVRRFFDEAISLGPGDARATYLDIARVRFRERLPEPLYDEFVARYRDRLISKLGNHRPYFYPFKRILFWATR